MKRLVIVIISLVIVPCAFHGAAFAARTIQDEYLESAGRLRAQAAQETDPAKRDECLRQADEKERLAEANAPVEPDPIFKDDNEGNAQTRHNRAIKAQRELRCEQERARAGRNFTDSPDCSGSSDFDELWNEDDGQQDPNF
ncbi:MAG: hypothetical protein HY894_03820 [Deltaproteobacteria bacterium]|nr:hypothetical protein [Deltaproteobacteria bacterium]